MKLGIIFDSTQFIEESVHEIELELMLAVLLTALVCWLFLGSLSSTLNVVLAIPMSLLGTVAVIYFLGFTLNTFTLLGAVARRRHRRRRRDHGDGEHLPPRRDGARTGCAPRAKGPHEITFAALAATLAVIAIFLPVVFMKGVIGKFFLQFGVTLCVAVLLSYVEAITLAPARCAQILRHRRASGRSADRAAWSTAASTRLARGYAVRPRPRAAAAAAWCSARRPRVLLVGAVFVLTPPARASSCRRRIRAGSTSACRPRSAPTSARPTDILLKRAEAFVRRGPRSSGVFAVVGGFGGGGRQHRHHVRHPRARPTQRDEPGGSSRRCCARS